MLALANDSTLVLDFAREICRSSQFLLTSEFTQRALLYLAPHSKTLQKCCDTQSQLEATNRKVREIQVGLSEKMLASKDATGEAALRAYREETHRALNSLKNGNGLNLGSNPTDIPDLNALWHEAETLLTRNQNILEKFSKEIESAVALFTQNAENMLDHVAATDAMALAAAQLCTLSSYYPRGLSPEAEAARAGLLQVSGDSETMQHVLSLYELAEMAAAGQSAPQLPTQGYFAQLAKLKKQLSTSSPSADLRVLTELRDLYVSSGSTALAFYAALNCIAAGDTSHQTLFLAFESADQLGILCTLAESLRKVPDHANKRAILLQLYRIALRTGDSSGQQPLAALKTNHLMSAEKSFAESLECERAQQYDKAKEKAVSAWSHAKKDLANLSHLALQSMKLAHQIHFKMNHTAEENVNFSDTVVIQLLKLDSEDSLAWEILCGGVLDESAPGKQPWEALDQLLATVRSSTGAYIAGAYAHQRGDIPRMVHYLSKTGDHSQSALLAKIALADLAHTQGDHKKADQLIGYVSTWAPHHSLLPRLALPGASVRIRKPGIIPPQGLPVGEWESTTRLAIANALVAAQRGMPPAEALSTIPEYAKLRNLLEPHSPLFQKCRDTARELKEYVDTLTPFVDQSNPLTWGHLLWSSNQIHWSSAVHIHEALNPGGHTYTLGQMVNLLDDLERAVVVLDPWMQHFAPLRLRDRISQAAQSARRAHGRCTELFTTSKDEAAKAQSVVELISQITQVRDLLVSEVSNNLLRGKDALAEWTDKLLSLPAEGLLETSFHKRSQIQSNRKVRLKEGP
jgi:hypothetical protein